jgi:hypothetical protein
MLYEIDVLVKAIKEKERPPESLLKRRLKNKLVTKLKDNTRL